MISGNFLKNEKQTNCLVDVQEHGNMHEDFNYQCLLNGQAIVRDKNFLWKFPILCLFMR